MSNARKSSVWHVAIGGMLTFFTLGSAHAAGLLTPVGQNTPLAIQDHLVQVVVEDGYVVTEVEQTFVNEGGRDLEAIYSFPVPEHASVGEFTYWIDGQPVTGEVVERQQARDIYEAEKSAGRETALVEKNEYKTFEISVYPVRAGQDVRTRLVYLQTAHTDTGVGRYVYPLAEGGVDEVQSSFWDMRDTVNGTFSFDLELKSSYPVDAVRVPDQPGAATMQLDAGHWRVALGSRDGTAADLDEQIAAIEAEAPVPVTREVRLDTDVVVYWRHTPDLPGSVDLVTYKPDADSRGTFMLTLTPGDDLPVITTGRDWTFVLDTSGSMQGKFSTLAEGVERALGELRENDRFRIFTFNNDVHAMTTKFISATPNAVQQHINQVRALTAGGGTNLHDGLQAALKRLDDDRPNGVVLVTDGVANVGVTQKRDFLELLEDHDVRLFTFIMGNSANRPLLEAMTEVSDGFAVSVSNSDDIVGRLRLAIGKLVHHSMNDVDIDIDGVRVSDLQPQRLGTVYHGEQMVLMGHYWKGGTASIQVTADVAGKNVSYQTEVQIPDIATDNPELERLWGYRTIESLQSQIDYFGEDADVKVAIQDLAIEYGLVTDYTSMIVLRDDVFDAMNIERKNRDRVTNERQARAKRAERGPVSRRADAAQPMYTQPRPSTGGGGGGSIGIVMLLGLALVGMLRRLAANSK
ncbi:MAG: VIT and VWA domain-containing protein [Pseudomonadota bacterium]